jgi:dihydrofolate reductase
MVGESRVTIHMVASLDGFIARKDGTTDWLETADSFEGGEELDPAYVRDFLKSIDCYVIGARTYETALGFEAKGYGWAYGDTPVFVLTHRAFPEARETVAFHSGDLTALIERLRGDYRSIWIAGGGTVAGECLRRGLADEVRVTLAPVLIGDGIPFFANLGGDVALHLMEAKAYKSGLVALRHAIHR